MKVDMHNDKIVFVSIFTHTIFCSILMFSPIGYSPEIAAFALKSKYQRFLRLFAISKPKVGFTFYLTVTEICFFLMH